ncbi:hypothetical protein D3C77_495460 [compost metagenome]
MQIGQGGLRAIAFILSQPYVFISDRAALFVDDFLAHIDRHDLVSEHPCRLRRRSALLRLQAVGVLGLTADVVAPGNDFSGLQHRHIRVFGHAQHRGIFGGSRRLHMRVLHQADLLLAGADGQLHAIDHDLFGGDGNGHQPGRALTVDGLAAD